MRQVVVTGMGIVSPYGIGVPRFLEAVRAGRCAIRPIDDLDIAGCRCTFGARVPRLDLAAFDGSGAFRRLPRPTRYTIVATDEALKEAGQSPPLWPPEGVSVFLATFRGMSEVSEQVWTKVIEGEPRFVPALLFQDTVTNAVASAISIRWGLRGTNYAISSGNAPGYQALSLAVQALRAARAEAVIAGSFDVFTSTNQHDLDDLGLLSASNSSRPFDSGRDGFVMGEGAAVVVLETLAHARARGTTVLAEITGVGTGHDAYGFARLHPDGRGLAMAMRAALDDARIEAARVDYVGAAANSTADLDRAESRAIRSVFPERAGAVPVSSLKALTGEAMAASDIFNLIACVAAVRDGIVPPQAGTEHVDGDCGVNVVRAGDTRMEVRTALANSYSYFGGNAAAAVVQACPA